MEETLIEPPLLVISVITMPAVSGDGIVAKIRKRPELNNVPVLFLWEEADAEINEELLKDVTHDFLTRSFFTLELKTRVRNLLLLKDAQNRYFRLRR